MTILWRLVDARGNRIPGEGGGARDRGATDELTPVGSSRPAVDIVTLPLAQGMEQAAQALRAGRLVAFPTETVYGLGGLACNEDAVRAIFKAKGRPADNPLIAHVSRYEQLAYLCNDISPLAWTLMHTFWPGPLSVLLPVRAGVPPVLTGGQPFVAVRMPDHPLARALIDAVGEPLAAPSANRSGRPSPTTAEHVLEDFAPTRASANAVGPTSDRLLVAGVIDGGACRVGIESTVVACDHDRIVILRPGQVDAAALATVCPDVSFDPHLSGTDPTQAPRAPGQKYTHYAPRGYAALVEGEDRARVHEIMLERAMHAHGRGLRVALLPLLPLSAESERAFHRAADLFYPLGPAADPEAVARHLYAALHACDTAQCHQIFIESPARTPHSLAVLNRLDKATSGQRISL